MLVHNGLKNSRALVISSSDVDHNMYLDPLRSLGIDCCATGCLVEAIQFLDAIADKNISIDLVVIDCEKTISDGEDLAYKLKKFAIFADTRVLVARNAKSPKDQVTPILHCIDEFFTKPILPSELDEVLERLLNIDHSKPIDETEAEPQIFGIDVLIAEDNEVNQVVFTQVLNDLGVNFKIAENGEQAIELWKAHSPAIVLMDVSMPVMNGHEATRKIRTIEKESGLRHTPICAITAHALKGDKEDCFNAGMDDYLSKPVSPDMMAEKIDLLLSSSHVSSGKSAAAA